MNGSWGTHFQWLVSDDKVSVHLGHTGFAAHLFKENNVQKRHVTPGATPFWSGLPIDAVPESDEDNKNPAPIKQWCKYQSIAGSIGWLANSTHPDLAAIHSFLAAYSNKLSKRYWSAALNILHYIHSTIDYRITFTSKESASFHTYMLFLHSSDTEAWHNAIPPLTYQHHQLTTYSNACWGSQLGNTNREGTHRSNFRAWVAQEALYHGKLTIKKEHC